MITTLFAIGDVHLSKMDHIIPDFLQQQLEAISSILAKAKGEGVADIVFLGDLFHVPNPPQKTSAAFLELLVKNRELRYHFLVGNHDSVASGDHSMEVYGVLQRAKLLDITVYDRPKAVKIGGRKYWMCPHPFAEAPPVEVDLCFGHFPWSGAKRDNGSVSGTGQNPKGQWVLGDFHTHQEGKRFMYAGSLTQLSWGERLPKGFIEVAGKKASFVKIKPPYVLREATVSSLKELEALERKGTYWHVICGGEFTMPNDHSLRFPHVLAHRPEISQAKEVVSSAMFAGLTLDPLDNLGPWLKKRDVLTEKEMAWATRWASKNRK